MKDYENNELSNSERLQEILLAGERQKNLEKQVLVDFLYNRVVELEKENNRLKKIQRKHISAWKISKDYADV